MSRAERHKSAKAKKFRRFYLVYIIVLFAAIIGLWIYAWTASEIYEEENAYSVIDQLAKDYGEEVGAELTYRDYYTEDMLQTEKMYVLYDGDTAVAKATIEVKGKGLVGMDLYQIKSIEPIEQPEPEVKEESPSYETESSVITDNRPYEEMSEAEVLELSDYLNDFVYQYSHYLSNDSSWSKMSGYVLEGSDVAKSLKQAPVQFYVTHEDTRLEDLVFDEYRAYDGGEISVHAVYKYVVHGYSSSGHEFTTPYNNDLVFYFKDDNGVWKLSNLIIN